jgi:hypothetical protein
MGLFGKEKKSGNSHWLTGNLDRRKKSNRGLEGAARNLGNKAVKGVVNGVTGVVASGLASTSTSTSKTSVNNSLDAYANATRAENERVVARAEAEKRRAEAKAIEDERKRAELEDMANRPWLYDEIFKTKSGIDSIIFSDQINDLEQTISKLLTIQLTQAKEIISSSTQSIQLKQMAANKGNTFDFKTDPSARMESVIAAQNPYQTQLDVMDCAITKAKEGIRKLSRFEDVPNLDFRIRDCQDMLDDLKALIPKIEEKKVVNDKSRKVQVIVAVGILVILISIVLFFA